MDALPSPFWLLLIPALACGLLGLLLCRPPGRRGRRFLRLCAACCLLLVAVLLGGLSLTLRQYQRITADVEVARVELRQLGPQRFEATLSREAQDPRTFELHGDQWQLDARVVRWELPALLAGAPPLYRLERIGGRYQDIDQEREATRTVHALDTGRLPDLWDLRQRHPRWLPFVDTRFGSATYMPMLDGARYEVVFNPRGGLVARPADLATREAVEGW